MLSTQNFFTEDAHSNTMVPCHVIDNQRCAGIAIYRSNALKKVPPPLTFWNKSMPEGPEVRRVAQTLTRLEEKTITKGLVVSGRYLRGSLHGLDEIVGMKLDRVAVKGKLITFYLRGNEPLAILSTLGMSGWWVVLDSKEHEWDAHRRIELQFEDGTVAAFFDPRNFGTFKVVSHSEAKRKQAELGPDILTPEFLWSIALPDFFTRVKRFAKKQTLAEGLLDQRICSGCGNYIRADAMYLARLSPHRIMSDLSEEELKKIWRAMYVIATHASRNEPPPIELDTNARIKANGFVNLCYHQEISPSGAKITSYKDVNDRTVWWSPTEQL